MKSIYCNVSTFVLAFLFVVVGVDVDARLVNNESHVRVGMIGSRPGPSHTSVWQGFSNARGITTTTAFSNKFGSPFHLIIADSGNSRLVVCDPHTGHQVDVIINDQLHNPRDMVVMEDKHFNNVIFVADYKAVWKLTLEGKIINTFVTVDAKLKSTSAIALVPPNNDTTTAAVLVSDSDNHRIVMLNTDTGAVIRIYQTTNPSLDQFASGLAVDTTRGVIMVSDGDNYRVVEIDMVTGAMLNVYTTTNPSLNRVGGIAITPNVLYITDTGNARVIAVSRMNHSIIQVFNPDVPMTSPVGVTVAPDGAIYVIDNHILISKQTPNINVTNTIFRFTPDGHQDTKVRSDYVELPLPNALAWYEDMVYVADRIAGSIIVLDAKTGHFIKTYGTDLSFKTQAVCVSPLDGTVYVIAYKYNSPDPSNVVMSFKSNGSPGQFRAPDTEGWYFAPGCSAGMNGNVYLTSNFGIAYVCDSTGVVLLQFQIERSVIGGNIAVDSWGSIYITSYGSAVVQKYTSQGILHRTFTSPYLNQVYQVTVSATAPWSHVFVTGLYAPPAFGNITSVLIAFDAQGSEQWVSMDPMIFQSPYGLTVTPTSPEQVFVTGKGNILMFTNPQHNMADSTLV